MILFALLLYTVYYQGIDCFFEIGSHITYCSVIGKLQFLHEMHLNESHFVLVLNFFVCVLLQVRTFYSEVLNEEERQRLCQNLAGALKGAQLFIQKRMVSPHHLILSTQSVSPYCLSCCGAFICTVVFKIIAVQHH